MGTLHVLKTSSNEMSTVYGPATLQSMFDNPTFSDLLIEAGAQCVRTFRVHKSILSPAIAFIRRRCTLPNGSPIPGQTRVRIPENPDVVETMVRHVYGFQSPRLQVKSIRDIDLETKSLWQEFSFFMDLRKTSREYELESLNNITALLIGACIQHERVDDNELILRICRTVYQERFHSGANLLALAAQEAHIRRRTSGALVYSRSSLGPWGIVEGRGIDSGETVNFEDKWRTRRGWTERDVKDDGLGWVLEGVVAECDDRFYTRRTGSRVEESG